MHGTALADRAFPNTSLGFGLRRWRRLRFDGGWWASVLSFRRLVVPLRTLSHIPRVWLGRSFRSLGLGAPECAECQVRYGDCHSQPLGAEHHPILGPVPHPADVWGLASPYSASSVHGSWLRLFSWIVKERSAEGVIM